MKKESLPAAPESELLLLLEELLVEEEPELDELELASEAAAPMETMSVLQRFSLLQKQAVVLAVT